MNLLPLANVVSTVLDWDYFWHWTHDQELGKALISAIAPIAMAIIAALSLILTARRETQQMELSKQGTPPELTRYKEWLEVSEKYTKLMGYKRVDDLQNDSEEYREIEASRKASLDRAVWERKVFTSCPNRRVQEVLMQINPARIFRIVKSANQEVIPSSDVYVYPGGRVYLIGFGIWSLMYLLNMTLICIYLYNQDYRHALLYLLEVPLVFIAAPLYCQAMPDSVSGVVKSNYYFRKIIISHGYKFEININAEMRNMSRRLRSLLFSSSDLGIVYCPWEDKGPLAAGWIKCVTYFKSGYYVRKGFKNQDSVLWGSYKEELLNGDLKKKLGREDTQAPNSDIQEESQPAPPQG